MPKHPLQSALLYVGLVAYALNSTVLAWGLVKCEEAGGELAIELAGDHSQCNGLPAPRHGHDDADPPPAECDACASCPCIDTPVGVAAATPSKKTAPADPVLVSGLCPGTSAAAPRPGTRASCAVGADAAPRAARVTQRCLRSVVLRL